MNRKLHLGWLSILGWLMLVGCTQQPTATPPPVVGLPNPASVNCTDNKGLLEMRQDELGNAFGVCKFEDGSECEEWAYYRGECQPGDSLTVGLANPASVYCTDHAGTLEIRKDDAGNESGFCKFENGSECEEWAYYRGECQPTP